MSLAKIQVVLTNKILEIERERPLKGHEKIITKIISGKDGLGPRYCLAGCGGREFLRMNSNSYLGLNFHEKVILAEEQAVRQYGCGPGAVRFISGTFQPHVDLENELANFHSRESAILFSSAYGAVMGVVSSLISPGTVVISDALNHNSIINAIRLAKPAVKAIYKHLDPADLGDTLKKYCQHGNRAIVITDGIFSMRGEQAPLARIAALCTEYDSLYSEGVILIVDDSHGIGAFGMTGRGTEEKTNTRADILIGTLGKAFGVNGGYAVSTKPVIDFLRETAPLYIYSNPITPSEAAAALQSLAILASDEGLSLLVQLRRLTRKFKDGLQNMGYEIIPSDHPIVPLMIRDTGKTGVMVQLLFDNGILVTGLNFPVVPEGDQEIRFQVNASHTEKDIDWVLEVLRD